MTTYTIYRAVFTDTIDDVDLSNIGTNWAVEQFYAEDFADQFLDRGNYIVLSAKVTADQINIAQTNGQWNSEHAGEGEVVLMEGVDISVEHDETTYQANTGLADFDESRPDPEECEESEITDYLYE